MNRRAMTIKRNYRLLPLVAAAILAACSPKAAEKGPLDGASIGGPFTLSDSAGKQVRWSDFAGKYRIVYFGYTYCPDVCPTDMGRIARGYAAFKKAHPDRAAQVVPIFITVDPERDTQAKVGEFTHAFSDDIVGLTGTPEEIASAVKEFKIYVEKGKPNAEGAYLVNHSNAVYLMGREGEPIALLPIDVKDQGQAIAAELERWTS